MVFLLKEWLFLLSSAPDLESPEAPRPARGFQGAPGVLQFPGSSRSPGSPVDGAKWSKREVFFFSGFNCEHVTRTVFG